MGRRHAWEDGNLGSNLQHEVVVSSAISVAVCGGSMCPPLEPPLPLEQWSKKLHFSLMMASLISKKFLLMIVDQGANHGDPLGPNWAHEPCQEVSTSTFVYSIIPFLKYQYFRKKGQKSISSATKIGSIRLVMKKWYKFRGSYLERNQEHPNV